MEPARTAARALCRRAARDVQPRAGGRGLMAMSAPSGGAGRRRGRGGRRAPMSESNVTPLVDVMLVLLILFMITAPLLASAVPLNPIGRAWRRSRGCQIVDISVSAVPFKKKKILS